MVSVLPDVLTSYSGGPTNSILEQSIMVSRV
jgi:hypothetical protein